jgi:hypothetical protein
MLIWYDLLSNQNYYYYHYHYYYSQNVGLQQEVPSLRDFFFANMGVDERITLELIFHREL